jgi:hypothetical protein
VALVGKCFPTLGVRWDKGGRVNQAKHLFACFGLLR